MLQLNQNDFQLVIDSDRSLMVDPKCSQAELISPVLEPLKHCWIMKAESQQTLPLLLPSNIKGTNRRKYTKHILKIFTFS